MPRSTEYDSLLNKYNIAIAQIRDMREQMQTKDRQFRDYEAKHDVIEGHARKLCEAILAKDKSEMVLGTSSSWHSLGTDDLIAKALSSFVKYCHDRTELLNSVAAVAEQRGRELESLKDQIEQMLRFGNVAATSSEELLERAERAEKEKSALKQAPYATQQAAASGQLSVIYEDPEDGDECEIEAISEMLDMAQQAKLTPGSTPVARCPQKSELIKKAQDNVSLVHLVDLQKYIDACGEGEWEVLRVMGEDGLSFGSDIRQKCIENGVFKNETAANRAINTLRNMNAVNAEKITPPLSKVKLVVTFTTIGVSMYEHRFKKKAVVSEMEKLVKQHDNPVHALGIADAEDVLKNWGTYHTVTSNNRYEPIDVVVDGVHHQYIPDIICKSEKFTDYFEYERGNHTQADFEMKCKKMSRVTNFLNFIGNNQGVAIRLKKQIDKWLETLDDKHLPRKTIRIYTVQSLQKEKCLVKYNLATGKQPVEDYLTK